jgi:protein phosphatase
MRAAALTDSGRARKGNEDCVHIEPALGLLILADGMGGHEGGEVASRLAVDTINSSLHASVAAGQRPVEDSIRQAIAVADQAILAKAAESPSLEGMGTTVVVTLCGPDSLLLAHVGDSRAYLWRDGVLRQLTEDHSLVAHMVRTGALTPQDAKGYSMRNVLVRSVGNRNTPQADVLSVAWRAGDCLLLCSDGLTGMVTDDDIRKILAAPDTTLEQKCQELVRLANQHGGKDNISVILASPN